jgi:hypothetical protein
MLSFAFACLGLGFLGVAFPVLATAPQAWVHHLPYGAILLLLLGLLTLVDRLPASLAWPVPVLAMCYSLIVWIGPALLWADRLIWTASVGVAAGVALAAAAVASIVTRTVGEVGDRCCPSPRGTVRALQ